MAEQRYRAVLAVISDGRTVTDVAAAVGAAWRLAKLPNDEFDLPPTEPSRAGQL